MRRFISGYDTCAGYFGRMRVLCGRVCIGEDMCGGMEFDADKFDECDMKFSVCETLRVEYTCARTRRKGGRRIPEYMYIQVRGGCVRVKEG